MRLVWFKMFHLFIFLHATTLVAFESHSNVRFSTMWTCSHQLFQTITTKLSQIISYHTRMKAIGTEIYCRYTSHHRLCECALEISWISKRDAVCFRSLYSPIFIVHLNLFVVKCHTALLLTYLHCCAREELHSITSSVLRLQYSVYWILKGISFTFGYFSNIFW